MLKKRLVGVITVKNGWAVQSFGYRSYLPLGTPECLVENLDRWGADEILVQVIDRSAGKRGPDFDLIERIARLGLSTPLIYGGGIATVEQGVRVIQTGSDRLIVDALLKDNPAVVADLSTQLGVQAIIASMPVSAGTGGMEWYDYRENTSVPLNEDSVQLIQQNAISEVLLIDWRHEGYPGSFDSTLVDKFPYKKVPLILFGGISSVDQMRTLIYHRKVSALSIGNFLNYREHSIQEFKQRLASEQVRNPYYQSDYSLQAHV